MLQELLAIMVLQKVIGNSQMGIGNGKKEMESMQRVHGNP